MAICVTRRERCSCGSEYEAGSDYSSNLNAMREELREWRTSHRCGLVFASPLGLPEPTQPTS